MPSRDFKRTDRVGAELRREIGLLVHGPCATMRCLRSASPMSRSPSDLDWATVWVTALQPEKAPEAMKALKELAVEFRRELSRGMRMRRVPELRFKYDDSVDKGERIEAIAARTVCRTKRRTTTPNEASSQRMSQIAERLRAPWRDLHGLLLLDKPLGLSSNQALQSARELFSRGQGRAYRCTGSIGHGLVAVVLWRGHQAGRAVAGFAQGLPWPGAAGRDHRTADAGGRGTAAAAAGCRWTTRRSSPPWQRLRGRIWQVPPVYSR